MRVSVLVGGLLVFIYSGVFTGLLRHVQMCCMKARPLGHVEDRGVLFIFFFEDDDDGGGDDDAFQGTFNSVFLGLRGVPSNHCHWFSRSICSVSFIASHSLNE
ncbi:hypothetical protein XENOCAPTIV_009973 [Xenoophorus captivus]|uniref:Secreted protein n=2 Tax=Goodeidae TaxID=28758 RepID=A0ABV0RQ79_9TELE